MSDERLILREWLLDHEGAKYRYGGKGPFVFDCSGLATDGLRILGGEDWRATHNAQRLFDELEPVAKEDLIPLDLVFYGPSPEKINHVMFWWGDGRVFGACGGDSKTLTDADAVKKRARVQFRSQVNYRPDFQDYRRLPLP